MIRLFPWAFCLPFYALGCESSRSGMRDDERDASSRDSNDARVDANGPHPDAAGFLDAETDAASALADASGSNERNDFSEPTPIVSTTGNSKTPSMVIGTDDRIHVAWHDFTTSLPSLYYAEREKGGKWTIEPLSFDGLENVRHVFPQLMLDEQILHLVWQTEIDGVTRTMHAQRTDAHWSTPLEVVNGSRPRIAIDGSGRIHVVTLDGMTPRHAILEGDVWRELDTIDIAHAYVDALDSALVGTQEGVEFALSTSPGETSYDIRTWSWSEATGWSDMQTLYSSFGLSSDDLDGALDSEGHVQWVWTEQDETDPNDIPIVTMSSRDALPTRVSHSDGFAMHPAIAISAMTAIVWSTKDETIALGFSPFETDITIGGERAFGPQVDFDSEGFAHVVFYGVDQDGIQQIHYSTNEPR